jgi:hypothetical protein
MRGSGRRETVFVLLLVQAASWLLAGLGALVFGLAGERAMLVQGILSIAFAWLVAGLAVMLILRARGARGAALTLEWSCLLWSLLQAVLPIGNRLGLVALLTGLVLPVCVLATLHGRRAMMEFVARPPAPG